MTISQLERETIRGLVVLANDRDERETSIEREYKGEKAAIDRRLEEQLSTLKSRFDRDMATAEHDYSTTLEETRERMTKALQDHRRAYEAEKFKIKEQAEHDLTNAKKAWQEAKWTAETVYEAKEPQPKEKFEKTSKQLRGKLASLKGMEAQAAELFRSYHQKVPAGSEGDPAVEDTTGSGDAFQVLDRHMQRASERLLTIRRAFFARWFVGIKPFVVFMVVLGLAAAGWGWTTEWQFNDNQLLTWWAVGGGVAGVALLGSMYWLARRQITASHSQMMVEINAARAVHSSCIAQAEATRDRELQALQDARDQELRDAKETYEPQIAHVESLRKRLHKELDEQHVAKERELEERRARSLQEIEERHAARTADLNKRYDDDTRAARESHERAQQENEEQHTAAWNDLERRWTTGMAEANEAFARVVETVNPKFPPWKDPSWKNWTPHADFAEAVRIGEFEVNLQAIPGGIPRSERLLDVGPMSWTLPAVLDFPTRCSLLVEVGDEGRDEAVATLQNTMMRLLTSYPPGKVRFTIIDPVGLGQNFAGFMHLADFEEQFVADRIWTETRHIEQRLTDLTEHMENVIQKYLRNDFETITEYNKYAGEIAEPFRFLVIANFPINFSDTAARRLVSVVDSGPRCGVYTLISMDMRQQMPQGFQPEDLRKGGVVLQRNDDAFTLMDEELSRWPLSLDDAPTPEFMTGKLQLIGEAARDSTRVEVPFTHIAPDREQYWSQKANQEIRVPLGRAGATKLQYLEIGRGITQHALLAGKTGSGKSTLLHVLITNLALHYRPDEVEFYLVDFKKGVEFKTYATHNLPHARAVAIESDREFGLSVLQRVDEELKRRGEIFRRLGVQDLNAYRDTGEPERIPRTLLIIDEFQEFFVEDDKLAQDAGLLLDRLVRQGRAFGIHVLLGSQTLGGAYSLARSTMGQMAVRIALQCNEADAMLILDDDNTAARLLGRPGEAIYNDQSGLIEGNNPFQIVWLPEITREKYLREIEEMAQADGYSPPTPQIVFEGNVPADVSRNALLDSTLAAAPVTQASAAPVMWLGDAIAIKDPTAAVFRRQSGVNMLMVGQQDEAALAMQTVGLISLAAQCPLDGSIFYVLDGLAEDATHAGYFRTIARALPFDMRIVGWHDVPGAMEEISEELARRQASNRTDTPPIFLFVYGLHRFRMLRQEEEFGFSSTGPDEAAGRSPDKVFGDLLRDGPPFGMHTIAWCDTANNLSRSFDRRAMREFDMRVLFQMSANDSSNLIDSPTASLLGARRALYFSEDHGILEKFRPYALPEEDWLGKLAERLRAPTADMA